MFDAHAHVNTADVSRYPVDPIDGRLPPDALAHPLPGDALIAAMDANGITRAVVVQRCHVYGYDNSYTLDVAAAYPDRLRALCVIDGRADDAAAEARACLARSAAGVCYMEPEKGQGIGWLAGDNARAAWRATVEGGGVMRVHLFRWNRAEGLAAIAEMLDLMPDSRLVIDHLSNLDPSAAGHGIDDPLRALADRPNVSLLFSMINLKRWAAEGIDPAPVLSAVVALFGGERVMWGSDVGNTVGDYQAMIDRARAAAASLSEADRRQLFAGTAERVYGR